MKKRIFVILILLIAFILPSNAVLKEDSITTTLYILRSELTNAHLEMEKQAKQTKDSQKQLFEQITQILNQANQNALMLYSQKDGYIFDLAYACHEATEQFNKFKTQSKPFQKILRKNNIEVARYDSLINYLQKMPKQFLDERSQINRNVCLTLAVNIRRQLKETEEQLQQDQRIYDMIESRLQSLNDYADIRYQEIQNNIFNNLADNYFSILRSFNREMYQTENTVKEKYKPTPNSISQWDSKYIGFLFIILITWSFISIFINIIFFRFIFTWLIKKSNFTKIRDRFLAKRTPIIMAMTVVTFGIFLGIIRTSFAQNFFTMASGLLMQYTWLLGVILISLLLRVESDKIKSAFLIYAPLIVVGFIVIIFRVILIPNTLVNLIFPPILLFNLIWQAYVIYKKHYRVPRSDMFFSYISLTIFVASVILSWSGYTLGSVQLLIWWVMMLTCILTLNCLSQWLKSWGEAKEMEKKPVQKNWFFRLIYKVVLPCCGVFSFIVSIYWAAEVFNLSDTVWEIFKYHIVDSKEISFSLYGICMVINLWFIFNYIVKVANEIMEARFKAKDPTTAASRTVMTRNVTQALVWAIWLLGSLHILHVSWTWFVVVSGGLSTGIGFAMKDILENIYYGISLMAGRIKIGDYIVCDGIRGRVSSINYTSTMLEALDGSIIAFQNSQLFTKNYKNLTRNHGYELDTLEVGVAYGSNISEVKKLLKENVSKLDCVYKKKPVTVLLKSFDDSCITLKILVWVNVLTKALDDGEIMECIYKTLNDNNIEIPFPQREITIKSITSANVKELEKNTTSENK
ncbi:mechanosensitive ion channel domain-containing protein [Segatella bryantii]|uniref:mechanosensitive ion channel domain-containing protein n=1 Tax=Segatella bryantii TaxID=77095 RepID=UPI0028531980|nr:mechanosensitive ion channel domain-containing protein [Segatella bryantii]MDR4930528.1 mechanosensitive ion channel [Segatella bryantii]